jgi:hypothetical protein
VADSDDAEDAPFSDGEEDADSDGDDDDQDNDDDDGVLVSSDSSDGVDADDARATAPGTQDEGDNDQRIGAMLSVAVRQSQTPKSAAKATGLSQMLPNLTPRALQFQPQGTAADDVDLFELDVEEAAPASTASPRKLVTFAEPMAPTTPRKESQSTAAALREPGLTSALFPAPQPLAATPQSPSSQKAPAASPFKGMTSPRGPFSASLGAGSAHAVAPLERPVPDPPTKLHETPRLEATVGSASTLSTAAERSEPETPTKAHARAGSAANPITAPTKSAAAAVMDPVERNPITAPTKSAAAAVMDPVERAKKLARSAQGLDRFLIRGDQARALASASASVSTAAVGQPKPVKRSKQDSAEDVDDYADVASAEGSEEAPSKRAKVGSATAASASTLVDDEAMEVEDEEDGEEGAEGQREIPNEDDEEDEEDEENPGGVFVGLDDEDANFPDHVDDASNGPRELSGVEKELAEFEATAFRKEDADVFSAESSEHEATPVVVFEPPVPEEEDAEHIKAINRLRMEKDLAELNRIRDLYVLGQWKTEKLANRKQMGMEDYLDDEFQPAWNSIYNRDAIKHKLKKNEGDVGKADDEDGEAEREQDEADALLGDESDSAGEEEYQKKREKLKVTRQLQRVASLFSGPGENSLAGGGGELSRGASMLNASAELSRSATVMLGSDVSLAGDLSMDALGDSSNMLRLIDNRRETSNAGGGGNGAHSATGASGAFGLLKNAATLNDHAAPGGDPLKRLSLQRSNSKLVLHAQVNTHTHTHTHTHTRSPPRAFPRRRISSAQGARPTFLPW